MLKQLATSGIRNTSGLCASASSPPLVDWVSHGITNWIYSDPDPFVSHAEKTGTNFLKIFTAKYSWQHVCDKMFTLNVSRQMFTAKCSRQAPIWFVFIRITTSQNIKSSDISDDLNGGP